MLFEPAPCRPFCLLCGPSAKSEMTQNSRLHVLSPAPCTQPDHHTWGVFRAMHATADGFAGRTTALRAMIFPACRVDKLASFVTSTETQGFCFFWPVSCKNNYGSHRQFQAGPVWNRCRSRHTRFHASPVSAAPQTVLLSGSENKPQQAPCRTLSATPVLTEPNTQSLPCSQGGDVFSIREHVHGRTQ